MAAMAIRPYVYKEAIGLLLPFMAAMQALRSNHTGPIIYVLSGYRCSSDQPRREARAVCHETRWTNSSPAAISRQQLIQGDRQVADADAGGMIDSIGNRSGGADDPDFANPFRTHWIDMQILLLDPRHVDRADIGVGGDMVLGEVVVHVVAE